MSLQNVPQFCTHYEYTTHSHRFHSNVYSLSIKQDFSYRHAKFSRLLDYYTIILKRDLIMDT
jgi:hypothetical protein